MNGASLFGSMLLIGGCWIVQGLLVQLVPWSWAVPDLTLMAFVLAVGHAPHHWVLLASLAGVLTMVWTIRAPTQVLLSYLIFGGSIRVLAHRWDVTDQRVQILLASAGCIAMLIATLWADELWSLSLAGVMGLQAVMTGLAVPMARWLRGRMFRMHDA